MDPLSVVGASLRLTSSGVALTKTTAGWLGNLRFQRDRAKELGSLLGLGGQDGYSYRVGMLHPTLAHGTVHLDDQLAFGALAVGSLSRLTPMPWLRLEYVPCEPSDTIVTVGSAWPEGLTRLIFGYTARPGSEDLQYVGGVIDLPYRWAVSVNEVRSECFRYQPAGLICRRPNWGVVSMRQGFPQTLYPDLANDHFLVTDYLLITRLPNFLAEPDRGSALISLGGTHGVGTRSVELMAGDKRLIADLAHRVGTGKSKFFQVLLEASAIRHSPTHGSEAKRLRIVDFVPLQISDDQAAAARRTVASRFTDWVAEVSVRGERFAEG